MSSNLARCGFVDFVRISELVVNSEYCSCTGDPLPNPARHLARARLGRISKNGWIMDLPDPQSDTPLHSEGLVYSVSPKKSPLRFSDFFPSG